MVRITYLIALTLKYNPVALCSLGQLIKIIRQPQMETVVDKLIDFSGGQDEELRDISGLGMYDIPGSMCLFR